MRKYDRIESGFDVFGRMFDVNVKNMVRVSKYVMVYFMCFLLFVGRMNIIELSSINMIMGINMFSMKYLGCCFSLIEYFKVV